MKHVLIRLLVLLLAGLLFTGCYTQFTATSQDDEHQEEYTERDGLSIYYNPTWYRFGYNSFGLSPGQQSYTMNLTPIYNHPSMWLYYDENWLERKSHLLYGSFAQDASGSYKHQNVPRSTGLWAGMSSVNTRNSDDQIRDRTLANRSDQFEVTTRDRVNLPTIERAAGNEKQPNIRDRRDSDFRDRLERTRTLRSPLSGWTSWERTNSNGDRVQSRTGSTTRSSTSVNRSQTSSRSGNSAVRGSSSNRGNSSGNTTRSSGNNRSSDDSSSSSGNN